MSYPPYSVLMSVYKKEKPEWLRIAVDSMLAQTVKPSEIVMVKDGPLTVELDSVLHEYDTHNPNLFKFVSYPENHGLGFALSKGMLTCSNEIVVRMDTDDYAQPNRIELQLSAMEHSQLDLVGSQVIEFIDAPSKAVSHSQLPIGSNQILRYSRRRNPFRHPSMVLRRSKALEAGNYRSDYLFFEDWDLFNRMLALGCRAANLPEELVAMRVSSDFYGRRGGISYLPYIWRFKREQLRTGWFSLTDFVGSFVPHAVVCLMPNAIRSFIYTKMLRKTE